MNIHVLHDKAGASHTIELLATVLLVDGQETAILSFSQDEIRLSSAAGEICCTAEQFWRSFVGADPTPAEAGSLLAQGLAHWMALERLRQIEASVPKLSVPPYRLSPFMEQLLSTLDGTPEQTEAVARVLRVPVQAVLSWATPQHRLPSGIITVEAATETPQKPFVSARKMEVSQPTASTGVTENEQEKQFRWSRQRMAQLVNFLPSVSALDRNERCAAVARHFNWPIADVRARLEMLQAEVPEAQETASTRRARRREHATSTASEDE